MPSGKRSGRKCSATNASSSWGKRWACGGGTYAVTRGFYDEFGDRRILDTPIAEEAIVGTAVGAAPRY